MDIIYQPNTNPALLCDLVPQMLQIRQEKMTQNKTKPCHSLQTKFIIRSPFSLPYSHQGPAMEESWAEILGSQEAAP